MSRGQQNHPSLLAVVIHTFLVLITNGVWLIPLAIYYTMKYFANKK
jgi:hypothetical protein